MEFDNAFEVPLPVAQAWKVLIDIARIAPCMPGAELTEVIDDRTYRGKIAVRLGPVALSFAGTVAFQEIDEGAHSAKVAAQGSDNKGRGGANAVATFRLEAVAGGSKVLVHTDLKLSGAVAQYGRGVGIIQMTAGQIIAQFAGNLKAQLATDGVAAAAADREISPAAAQSVPASAPPPTSIAAAKSSPVVVRSAREAPPMLAAKPIAGLRLAAAVLWQAIKRLFGRG